LDHPFDLEIFPASAERWRDLEDLFGPRGACAGCWCMYWRLPRSQYELQKGEGNRAQLYSLVTAGEHTGLIGYSQGVPVAWAAAAPRADFATLQRSRVLKPVDDRPVWSLPCFFTRRGFRRKGITARMILAASDYAQRHGAAIVEAYPVELKQDSAPDVFIYTGIASTFRKLGFEEVARRSETRPIMRKILAAQA
jgi:GNAT superfamily N-acetyltransferase